MSFAGKRVLSLESRRSEETAELIRRNDGEPVVAPSMREAPLEANEAAFAFAERLQAGDFDMVVFTTGVGARQLASVLEARRPVEEFIEALRRVAVVVRGPKPAAVMREWRVPVAANVPEPNTWREIVDVIRDRPERRIAVQLYGREHPDLIEALRGLGAEVTAVPVYAYELPEDVEPLRDAVTRLAAESFEVVLFTTSQQIVHLMKIASEMGLADAVQQGLRKSLIASIGPTTTETLAEYGLKPDLEPSHPKLGILVKEAAEKSEEILWQKKI
jgi:uroporphyrinogen-III synthase